MISMVQTARDTSFDPAQIDASDKDQPTLLISGDEGDKLIGGSASDQLSGGAGDDILDGRQGDDFWPVEQAQTRSLLKPQVLP